MIGFRSEHTLTILAPLVLGTVLVCLPSSLMASEGFSIVFASFLSMNGATAKKDELSLLFDDQIELIQAEVSGQVYYRVVSKPSPDLQTVRRRLQQIKTGGFSDVWLLSSDVTFPADDEIDLSVKNMRADPAGEFEEQKLIVNVAADAESGEVPVEVIYEDSPDEFFGGFDEYDIAPSSSEDASDRKFEVGGQLALSSSYSYELDTRNLPELEPYDGVSKVQALLRAHTNLYFRQWRLHIEAKGYYDWFYELQGQDRFSRTVLDTQRSETEWHEVYIQGDLLENLNLKTGRQILSWGRSDNLRVLDQLNPLDLREPGSTDIEDIRLPVNMTRLRYSVNAWTLELIGIHEIRFNKLPAPGSEYLPRVVALPDEVIPGEDWNSEHALSLTGVFPGWDISFHHARLYDDRPYLATDGFAGPKLRHSKLNVSGFAFNRTLGAWLLKGEYARVENFRSINNPISHWDRSDILLGIEYGGLVNAQIALETSLQHLHDYRQTELSTLGVDEDLWQSAFRVSHTFMNERLNLLLVALFLGDRLDDGRVYRAMIEYKPVDALTASLGLVVYVAGRGQEISQFDDRDRVLIGLKYHF